MEAYLKCPCCGAELVVKARYPEKYTDERAATRDLEAERKALEDAVRREPRDRPIERMPSRRRAEGALPVTEPKESCFHTYELIDKIPDPLPPGVTKAWVQCFYCGDRRTVDLNPAPSSSAAVLLKKGVTVVGCSHCRGTGMVSDEWCTLSTPCPVCSGGRVPGGLD